MIRAINFLFVLAASITASACKPEAATTEETVHLAVNEQSFEIEAVGGTLQLVVTSAKLPSAVIRDAWITRSIGSISDHKTNIELDVAANTSTEGRTGSLNVICGEESLTVSVSQKGAEAVQPCPDVEPIDNAAYAFAGKLGMGWNLGNQMDAHANGVSSETCWGNAKATQATFDGVKAKGFKSVRIPITWLGHIGAGPDYAIDKAWLDRVEEIVGYAHKADLNVIINTHHDGADSKYWLDIKSAASDVAVQTSTIAEIKAVWGQIASRFKDSGDFLIFESFNEIHDGKWGWGANLTDGGKQYKCLGEWNQAFVDAVRATGGQNSTRYLLVPGYCTDPTLTVKYFTLPSDSAVGRLIVSVHCYEPSSYTLTGEFPEWGHSAGAGKRPSSGETEIISLFSQLQETFSARDIPVIIGETGCINRSSDRELSFRNYYLEFVFKAAKSYGLAPFIWDNGSKGTGNEANGFIDHGTGEYIANGEASVKVMRKAIYTEDKDYSLNTIYNNAP